MNALGASAGAPVGATGVFTRADWFRLAGFYAVIGALHLAGVGLFLHHVSAYPALAGLGFAAYMLGLRHAFDADHIAAVDDTVRLLMQSGQRPLGVGFFFSLGHSTVVLLLALALSLLAGAVATRLPGFAGTGKLVGTAISGIFLWVVGILNLLLLFDLLRLWRGRAHGGHAHVDELLARRGLLTRLFGKRGPGLVSRSWHMYPLGLLFGLGFDTASEIALLTMTAGAAAGDLPVGAVLSLPLLFAAGMSLMDTTDGVFMIKAYGWAFVNPLRRIFYNLFTTGLSVAVALVIGTVELLQVLFRGLGAQGPFAQAVIELDFGALGYAIVGVFLIAWGVSALFWRLSRQRDSGSREHLHAHASGKVHSHRHFD